MTAAEAMRPYVDMQIVGAHPDTDGGLILELGLVGRLGRRFVTIEARDDGAVEVTETVDPPAPRYRNRRGYTDAPTLAQHHIDQGDDRAEHDREQTDRCDP